MECGRNADPQILDQGSWRPSLPLRIVLLPVCFQRIGESAIKVPEECPAEKKPATHESTNHYLQKPAKLKYLPCQMYAPCTNLSYRARDPSSRSLGLNVTFLGCETLPFVRRQGFNRQGFNFESFRLSVSVADLDSS